MVNFGSWNDGNGTSCSDSRSTSRSKQAGSLKSILSLLSLFLVATVTFSNVVNAQTTQSQEIRLVPLSTTDQGNGIHSVAFNSPYTSVRQTVYPGYASARLNFEATPQIPVGATLQSFMWTHNNSGDFKLPSWLSFVQSWSPDAPNFVLNVNGTSHLAANKLSDMAIVDLVGSVSYSHGPARYIETDARSARLIVHLHVKQTVEERAAIGAHFTRKADNNGYKVFENKVANAVIPSFTIETGELYSLNCGTTETAGCVIGTPATDPAAANPIWVDQFSEIKLKSGVAKIVSPTALYGSRLEVAAGAKLILEGQTATTAFSVMSASRLTSFINNGEVVVKSGILRLIGTSMAGVGSITVEEGATLEIDTDQAVNFGEVPSGTKKTIIRNKGKVVFVSGTTRLTGAIVSTGVGVVTVGMAAKVTLAGSQTHILGGLFDGVGAVTSPNGLNAVGAIINGALTVDAKTALLVSAGVRVQGLGHITVGSGAVVQVSISFYDPVKFADAAIIATGPATERIEPGITNMGTILIEKGGIKTATGFLNKDAGAVEISETGYLHFTSGAAVNLFKGAYLSNKGDISLLSDAKVSFELALQSYSSIKAYTTGSAVIFSGPTTSVITRSTGKRVGQASATDVSHLFALYCAGALLVKDSARLRLVSPAPNSSDQEPARFFAGIVQNSGSIDIDANSVLETVSYAQNFQLSTVAEPLETHAVPHTGLVAEGAKLSSISNKKYTLSATTGMIAQADPAGLTEAKQPIDIVAGHIGGVNGSYIDGQVILGTKATIAPGSSFPGERVNKDGSYTGGEDAWKAVARATRSAGRFIAKALKLKEGSTLLLEVLNLGAAGNGYDQVDVTDKLELDGAVLNLTTTFDALAYSAASIETFSLSARGKHASIASVNAMNDLEKMSSQGLSSVAPSRRVARTQALSLAEQSYNGIPLSSAGVSMKTFMEGTEIFRLPIVTSGGLPVGQKFSKVSVNWIPTDAANPGRVSTFSTLSMDKAQYVDKQMYHSLKSALEKNFAVLSTDPIVNGELMTTSAPAPASSSSDHLAGFESQIQLAVEYSGGNVLLVGYDSKVGAASSASSASLLLTVIAVFTALFACLM